MRKSLVPLSLLTLCLLIASFGMGSLPKSKGIPKDGPKIVNIINFIRLLEPRDPKVTEQVLFETVEKQIALMKQYHLGGTFLLQYDALIDPRYQKLLKSLPDSSFEIGAWWEIPQPLVEKAGLKWRGRYPWDWHANVGFATGYTLHERELLADVYMQEFKKIFGYYPKSVGCWFIDEHTLAYLYQKYHIVASCNCKDQVGTDGYTLWGGYWNQAYYPSIKNAYMPAQHEKMQIPVPIFRMLGSDPIRQYDNGLGTERQGVVTLEPVYRFGGGDGKWVESYFKNFTEGKCTSFGYVQAGQENSFTWDAMARGLEIQFPLIARLRDEKKIRVETLRESGQWYRSHFKTTPATSVVVQTDKIDSTRQTVWFNSRYYRANLLWDKGTLRFRDLHLFDENLPSDYLTQPGTSNQCSFFTLPFVDGYLWSSPNTTAGLRLNELENGKSVPLEGTPLIMGDGPADQLLVGWMPTKATCSIAITFKQNQLSLKAVGEQFPDWVLDLTADAKASLPFKQVTSHRISCLFKGMRYDIVTKKGIFSKPASGAILRISPENQQIILQFEPSTLSGGKK